ncbi:hypothetical protein EJB05_16457, partial [Eragrostis curvula]
MLIQRPAQQLVRVVDGVGGGEQLVRFDVTQVLAVGGGVLAWIDLRDGILLCDVLAEHFEMRLVRLPPLMPGNEASFGVGVGFDGTASPCLRPIRDVIFCANGSIVKLVEMERHHHVTPNDDSGGGARTSTRDFTWTATVFERTVCSDKWEKRCTVNSVDLAPAADSISLPDEIWSYEENKMNRVVCRDPMLGVYGENVVYMICRLDARDSKGWVLPVDTERRELGKAMAFSAESSKYIEILF